MTQYETYTRQSGSRPGPDWRPYRPSSEIKRVLTTWPGSIVVLNYETEHERIIREAESPGDRFTVCAVPGTLDFQVWDTQSDRAVTTHHYGISRAQPRAREDAERLNKKWEGR